MGQLCSWPHNQSAECDNTSIWFWYGFDHTVLTLELVFCWICKVDIFELIMMIEGSAQLLYPIMPWYTLGGLGGLRGRPAVFCLKRKARYGLDYDDTRPDMVLTMMIQVWEEMVEATPISDTANTSTVCPLRAGFFQKKWKLFEAFLHFYGWRGKTVSRGNSP